jgi:hypothetical protein
MRSRSGRMQRWLWQHATPRAIVIVALVYVATLVAMEVTQRPMHAAAPGVGTLDLTFGYDHASAIDVLGAYGEAGRRAYALFLLFDSLMPIAFAGVGLLLIARFAPKWSPLLAAAPIAFMTFDLVENAAFLAMIGQYPDVSSSLVAFARPITTVKLASFVIAMPTIVVLFVVFLVTGLRRRLAATPHARS